MALVRNGYANFASFPVTGAIDIIYVDLSNENEYTWITSTYVAYVPTKVIVSLGYKSVSWFSANPTFLLGKGQHVHLSDGAAEFVDAYVIGDGITELQDLPWKGLKYTYPNTKVIGEQTVVSGNTATLNHAPINGTYEGYLNGSRAGIGAGFRILSITGNTVTFDSTDYDGTDLISDYEY